MLVAELGGMGVLAEVIADHGVEDVGLDGQVEAGGAGCYADFDRDGAGA